MRKILWCALAAVWAAGTVVAEAEWRWRVAALTTDGWYTVRLEAAAEPGGGLKLRPSGALNGFLIPLASRERQAVAAEAELTVVGKGTPENGTINAERSTLTVQGEKGGWNLAGVTLFQDDGNLWLLALVEGPDGRRSVDFLESKDGVWQAQNEAATRLAREGKITFDWKPSIAYRLRLELADGRVSAQVSEREGGRVCGSAVYALAAR